MILVIIMSIAIILGTTALHLALFSMLSRWIKSSNKLGNTKIYVFMISIFIIHLFDIILYAVAFYLSSNILDLGTLEGDGFEGVFGHFYTSAVIYTTLGFGDVIPTGHLRCLAATEALNGLLFISWSAAFIFATVGKFWGDAGRKESIDG